MGEDLLTPQEVADILKVRKTTVYEMIKRGEIPSQKIGKQLRIPSGELRRLIGPEEAAQSAARPAAKSGSLVLCGQDAALDILASRFSKTPGMPNIFRSQEGSYNGLHMLYLGGVDITTCHLWDQKTGEYNLPFIERLLPGIPAVVMRLFGRTVGFYVKKGNPKALTGWEDLGRADLRFVNREKGSGIRVLLDGKLRALDIPRLSLSGYADEQGSHLAVAGAVSRGEADFGLGIERVAAQARDIAFIPLHREWYDMVIPAERFEEPAMRAIVDYVSSRQFFLDVSQLGNYDFSQNGRVFRL